MDGWMQLEVAFFDETFKKKVVMVKPIHIKQ